MTTRCGHDITRTAIVRIVTIVLERPTGVELRAVDTLTRTSGMRVRLAVVDEFTGAVDWAPDYRAVSDPFTDLDGQVYVRVATERAWYTWTDATEWPRGSKAWPARLVLAELAVR